MAIGHCPRYSVIPGRRSRCFPIPQGRPVLLDEVRDARAYVRKMVKITRPGRIAKARSPRYPLKLAEYLSGIAEVLFVVQS